MDKQTFIEIYNPETNMYIGEININHLGIENINAMVPPRHHDKGYYNANPLTRAQFKLMQDKIEDLRKYKFEDDGFFVQTRTLKDSGISD